MNSNVSHESSGIGPFKFRTKTTSIYDNLLNEFKDNNYKFEYVPDNIEDLIEISDSLLHFNLTKKYNNINYSKQPVNTQSLFEYEKQNGKETNHFEPHKKEILDKRFGETNKIQSNQRLHNNSIHSDKIKQEENNKNPNNVKDNNFNKDDYDSNNSMDQSTLARYNRYNNIIKHAIQEENRISNQIKRKKVNENLELKEQNNRIDVDISKILNGVTIVISGIENPERGEIRNLALKMGAKYNPKWTNSSTHLICTVKGTPKYNEVKAQGRGKIVKPSWIYKCYEKKKRLLEERYDLDMKKSSSSSDDETETDIDSDTNVDTNSDKNIRNNKNNNSLKIQKDDTQSNKKTNSFDSGSTSKTILFDKKGDIDQSKTEIKAKDDEDHSDLSDITRIFSIPSIFKNLFFYLDDSIYEKPKNELKRYILGHGGKLSDSLNSEVTHYCTAKDTSEVNIKKEVNFQGTIINPIYIIECHNKSQLI